MPFLEPAYFSPSNNIEVRFKIKEKDTHNSGHLKAKKQDDHGKTKDIQKSCVRDNADLFQRFMAGHSNLLSQGIIQKFMN